MSKAKSILLSFDVEEFDIPLEYGQKISPDEQMQVGGEGFKKVLDLLDRVNVQATLFTTAAFAERWSDLMKRASEKHEIASHGYHHSSFEEADLAKSREVLRRITLQDITGFRRARFGQTDIRAIRDAGYLYDSSENPIYLPGRYNHFFKPRTAYDKSGVMEIPVSASPLVRIPLFWLAFKNFPISFYRAVSAWTLMQDGYLNLFFHPWEFCDLTKYQLPRIVKRWDGDLLIEHLEVYLKWLKKKAEFQSLSDFVATRNTK